MIHRAALLPYMALLLLIAAIFAVLLILGLELGFYGDILQFEYVLQTSGIRDAVRWFFLEAFNRHPIAAHHYAIAHLLAPGRSIGWYGTSILYHLLTVLPAFLLIDSLLRQRWRAISFAVVFLFLFHARQYQSYFGDAFSGFVRLSLAFELVSLWLYLRYIRRGRKNHLWRDFSILAYFIGMNFYETIFLFVGLHWIISYMEERPLAQRADLFRWFWQVLKDSYLYLVFAGMYLYFLLAYFPNTAVSIAPDRIIPEIIRLFQVEFGGYARRLLPAFAAEWFAVTLILSAVAFVWLWLCVREADLRKNDFRSIMAVLAVLGLAMMLLNALLSVQTMFLPADTPRLAYPFQLGLALVMVGALAALVSFLPNAVARRIVFVSIIAMIAGASGTVLFQTREALDRENQVRQQILAAVKQAVPQFDDGLSPYILLLTDESYNEELIEALHARDANFALHFALLYERKDIGADVFYYNLPEALQPDPGEHGEDYRGPYIVVEEEGIYSPLRPLLPDPYRPVDPDGLVVLYYDPQSITVEVLDEVPIELFEKANIIERVFVDLRTNRDLLHIP